jgi:hypothetical protein
MGSWGFGLVLCQTTKLFEILILTGIERIESIACTSYIESTIAAL